MLRRIFVMSLLMSPLLSACVTPAPSGAPSDFALTYDWREGSLPPPYHYSYQIELAADGAGTIAFTPGYDGPEVPTWVETFQLSSAERDALYSALVEQGLLRERWRADPLPPIGGSSATLRVTADGQTATLPDFVIAAQQERVAAMHALVEAQVPEAIWTKLRMQHEEYVAEQGG